jgi:flagellar hook-length control protein FliK
MDCEHSIVFRFFMQSRCFALPQIIQNPFTSPVAQSSSKNTRDPRSSDANSRPRRSDDHSTKRVEERSTRSTDRDLVKVTDPDTDFANLLVENPIAPLPEIVPAATNPLKPTAEASVSEGPLPEVIGQKFPVNFASPPAGIEPGSPSRGLQSTIPWDAGTNDTAGLNATTNVSTVETFTSKLANELASELASELANELTSKLTSGTPAIQTLSTKSETEPIAPKILESPTTAQPFTGLDIPDSAAPPVTGAMVATQAISQIERTLEPTTAETSPRRLNRPESAEPLDSDYQQQLANLAKLKALIVNQQAGHAEQSKTGEGNERSFENGLSEPVATATTESRPNNEINTGIQSLEVSSLETGSTKSVSEIRSAVAESVVNQVVDTIAADAVLTRGLNMREMTLQIHPAELGQLDILIGADDDAMRAQIIASESVTSELLTREKAHLVNALREQGIDLPDVDISHRDPRDQDQQQFDAQRRSQRASGNEMKLTNRETESGTPSVTYLRNNSTIDMVA